MIVWKNIFYIMIVWKNTFILWLSEKNIFYYDSKIQSSGNIGKILMLSTIHERLSFKTFVADAVLVFNKVGKELVPCIM